MNSRHRKTLAAIFARPTSASVNTMTYRGYTARLEYDERDNLFVGRILGIRNIISFHGETVTQLRAEFERAVKDYLADCKERGIHPEKPVSGKLLLRVPPEIHGRALVAAQAAGKSLNQWATEVLQRAVQPG
jgi:predicted HicB family RNase H-like nuclease